jgi:hypothetical protein
MYEKSNILKNGGKIDYSKKIGTINYSKKSRKNQTTLKKVGKTNQSIQLISAILSKLFK